MLSYMLLFPEAERANLFAVLGWTFSAPSLVQFRNTACGENPLFHTKFSLPHQYKEVEKSLNKTLE